MRVMGCVRDFTYYLCFLDDIQLRTLVFVDRRKVLWFYRTTNNSKTMEKTKRVLAESTVGSGVEINSLVRVAETTVLAHGAGATATVKSG